MAKTKGVCKLFAKSDENFTKDLEIGKVYDFEMEYIDKLKENGYFIIVSPTEIKKIVESFFVKYFKVKPVEAPKEKETEIIVEGKEEVFHSTDSVKKNTLSGPKAEKTPVNENHAEVRNSDSILQGWDNYEHLINSITLRPFDGKSGMVNVIVNIKPDIDLTMTGPAANVFGSILQSLEKLTTLDGKIKDLEKIIDERIKLETKKKAEAEKNVEKVSDKPAEIADKVVDKGKGKGKAVDTTPKATQQSLDMGAGGESTSNGAEPTPDKQELEDDKVEETTDVEEGNAAEMDNW